MKQFNSANPKGITQGKSINTGDANAEHINLHGVRSGSRETWRTRSNNRPKVVRETTIDTNRCI